MPERLVKMTDQALIEFGRAATYMCSLEASMGNPRANFVLQLDALDNGRGDEFRQRYARGSLTSWPPKSLKSLTQSERARRSE